MSRVTTRPMAGAGPAHLPPVAPSGPTLSQAINAVATLVTIDLDRAIRGLSEPRRAEHRLLADEVQGMLADGVRPWLRVDVIGCDGLHVHLFVHGVPGAIAHTRTRRHAREIARPALGSILGIDPYAFDLEVDGA